MISRLVLSVRDRWAPLPKNKKTRGAGVRRGTGKLRGFGLASRKPKIHPGGWSSKAPPISYNSYISTQMAIAEPRLCEKLTIKMLSERARDRQVFYPSSRAFLRRPWLLQMPSAEGLGGIEPVSCCRIIAPRGVEGCLSGVRGNNKKLKIFLL